MHFKPFWNVSCHFLFCLSHRMYPQHPLSRPPQRLPGLLSNMQHSHPLISLALPSSFIIFPIHSDALRNRNPRNCASMCNLLPHKFSSRVPQASLGELRKLLPIYHRGLRSTASCFRCACDAQRTVRAVQCGAWLWALTRARQSRMSVSEHSLNAQQTHIRDYKLPASAGGS